MKKLFLLFFISLLSFGIHAQDRFSVGVKAGYTSTKFKLDNYDQRWFNIDENVGSGYLAGIYTRVRVFRGLSVQPELYYAKKKGEISYSGGTTEFPIPDSSYTVTLNSVELPLLLHLRLLDFDVANVYLVGGPILAFNNSNSIEPPVAINFSKPTSPPSDFVFNDSNWTFMFGGGVEFWRMTVDARYEWSLTDVAAMDDVGKYYNMLSISVGFKLFGL